MKDNFITEAFIFTLANTWNKKHQSYFLVNSFICFPSEHCGIQRTILFFLIMQKKKKTFYQTGHGFSVLLQCTCMLGSLFTMLIKGQVINVSFLFFEKTLRSWNKPQPWTENESIGLFEAILFFIAVAFALLKFFIVFKPKTNKKYPAGKCVGYTPDTRMLQKWIHPTIGWRREEHGTHKHARGSWILCSVPRVRSKTIHSLICITS